MSYSCLEELQVDLDLHMPDKTSILYNAGCQYDDGWLIITDDGICHLFDKDGNPDDITKITQLTEEYIRQDITKIVIPDSVTSIDCAAFCYCINLTSMMIPDSVTSIGWSAFSGCINLTNMTIPDSVRNIGNDAFYHCVNLTSVIIPDSVTSIGYGAFYYCDKLANLTFKDKTLEQVKKMKNYPWGIEDESIIRIG